MCITAIIFSLKNQHIDEKELRIEIIIDVTPKSSCRFTKGGMQQGWQGVILGSCPLLVPCLKAGEVRNRGLGQMEKGAIPSREAESRLAGAKLWNVYTRQETSRCTGLLWPREAWQPIKVVVKLWPCSLRHRAGLPRCRFILSDGRQERHSEHTTHRNSWLTPPGSSCFLSAFLG